MRTLSIPTGNAVAATITQPGYFVRLGFDTIVRLSSRGTQSCDGQTWTGGRLGKISGLNWDGKGQQSCTFEIVNTDLAYSALVLNEGVADRTAEIWKFYGDNPAAGDPVMVFDGVMDEANIAADKVTITAVGENTRTLYSPRRFIGPATGFNHLMPAGTKLSWGGQTITLERGR